MKNYFCLLCLWFWSPLAGYADFQPAPFESLVNHQIPDLSPVPDVDILVTEHPTDPDIFRIDFNILNPHYNALFVFIETSEGVFISQAPYPTPGIGIFIPGNVLRTGDYNIVVTPATFHGFGPDGEPIFQTHPEHQAQPIPLSLPQTEF